MEYKLNPFYKRPPSNPIQRLEVKRQLHAEVNRIQDFCHKARSRSRSNYDQIPSLDHKISFELNFLKTMINKKKSSLLQESFDIEEQFHNDKENDNPQKFELRKRSESSQFFKKINSDPITKFESPISAEKNHELQHPQIGDLFAKIKGILLEDEEKSMQQQNSEIKCLKDLDELMQKRNSNESANLLKILHEMMTDVVVPFVREQRKIQLNDSKLLQKQRGIKQLIFILNIKRGMQLRQVFCDFKSILQTCISVQGKKIQGLTILMRIQKNQSQKLFIQVFEQLKLLSLVSINHNITNALFFFKTYQKAISELVKIKSKSLDKIKARFFNNWRCHTKCMQVKDHFQNEDQIEISQRQLVQCKLELQKIKLEQELLTKRDIDKQEQLNLMHIENTIKSKCLSAAMLHNWLIRKQSSKTKVLNSIRVWRNTISNAGIQHLRARLRAGCYLVESTLKNMNRQSVRVGFKTLALQEIGVNNVQKSPSPIVKYKRHPMICQQTFQLQVPADITLDSNCDDQQSILWDIHQKQVNLTTPNNYSRSNISPSALTQSIRRKKHDNDQSFHSQRIRFQQVNDQLNCQSLQVGCQRTSQRQKSCESASGQVWSSKTKDFMRRLNGNHKRGNSSNISHATTQISFHTKNNSTILSDIINQSQV